MIPSHVIKQIKLDCDIRDHIPGATKGRGKCSVECPDCHKKGKDKGLIVTGPKGDSRFANTAKCWSCGLSIPNAIEAEMKFSGCDFPTAVKRCASTAKINIDDSQPKEDRKHRSEEPTLRHESFADLQLKASGLREADTLARRYDLEGNVIEEGVKVFVSGGVTPSWTYTPYEDEMVIRYLDLYGNPVQFATRGAAGRPKAYYRVRYQNPEGHVSKSGKPMKYHSPAGSKVSVMIPEYIRERFHRREEIETLFIQEGEKKAEKACKHGMPSLAIQGIYNIGNAESGLIKDIQRIIKECNVRNVVLMFDADWDSLSRDLKPGAQADSRPRQFAGAVLKFKQYMKTLHALNISVDVWFGHVNTSDSHDAKGIDDLLVGPMKGVEKELMTDIVTAMNSHDGHGKWCDVFKITSMTDFKIQDLWHLNDNGDFYRHHRAELEKIETFRINGVRLKAEGDSVVLDTDSGKIEKFWEIETKRAKESREEDQKKVKFKAYDCFKFLEANGFRKVENQSGFDIVKVEDGFLELSSEMRLRDFVCNFVHRESKTIQVREYFINSRGKILGHDKLENLSPIDCTLSYDQWEQWYHFADSSIKVTPNEVAESKDAPLAWKSVKLSRDFERIQIIKDIRFSKDNGWTVEYTEEAEDCEFLKFLINASNFWWKPSDGKKFNAQEHMQHMANKLTSIGYLLVDNKSRNETKAIVAMDARMSEVGKNNGRSGKSLIIQAIDKMRKTTIINGRGQDVNEKHKYSLVTRDTRVICFDDIAQRFNFADLFVDLTSDFVVNTKGGGMYVMKFEESPKIYITTNHTIQNLDDSALARINFISFSDFYNKSHQPTDDFGHLFFDSWTKYQWQLFDNLMLDCVMFYMRTAREAYVKAGCGLVPPPMEDIEARTLRQEIGENIIQWADSYYSPGSSYINSRQNRKDIYANFITENPGAQRFITSSKFGDKIRDYCRFRGLHFNIFRPHKETGEQFPDFNVKNPKKSFIGEYDKTGGNEFFTICTPEFAEQQKFF